MAEIASSKFFADMYPNGESGSKDINGSFGVERYLYVKNAVKITINIKIKEIIFLRVDIFILHFRIKIRYNKSAFSRRKQFGETNG